MKLSIDVNFNVSEEALKTISDSLKVIKDIQLNTVKVNGDTAAFAFQNKTPKEDKSKSNSVETKQTNSKALKSEIAKPSEAESKNVTLEEVRAKLATLSQDGKQAQVKALITEFGAKKLSDIPAGKYVELLKKAEEL